MIKKVHDKITNKCIYKLGVPNEVETDYIFSALQVKGR